MGESTKALEALAAGLLADEAPQPADLREAQALVEVAREQRLSGWLAARTRTRAGAWPAAALERLRHDERVLTARGLQQLDRAGELQQRLLRHGLRLLPLKGAALAESVYASVAERAMADVDLLALDSWADSVRVLVECGFVAGERADHASSFHDAVSGQTFELHHALVSCPGLFPFDADGLWERRQKGPGLVPFVPATEDLLVQLGLHAAFQHGLVLTLGQYLDFRRVLERRQVDAEQLASRARASRAGAALGAALTVARVLVGAAVPAALDVLHDELPRPLARWLARQSAPHAFLAPRVPALARVRWGLSRGRRLLFLARTLCPRERHEGLLRRVLRLARHGWRSGTFFPTKTAARLASGGPTP